MSINWSENMNVNNLIAQKFRSNLKKIIKALKEAERRGIVQDRIQLFDASLHDPFFITAKSADFVILEAMGWTYEKIKVGMSDIPAYGLANYDLVGEEMYFLPFSTGVKQFPLIDIEKMPYNLKKRMKRKMEYYSYHEKKGRFYVSIAELNDVGEFTFSEIADCIENALIGQTIR